MTESARSSPASEPFSPRVMIGVVAAAIAAVVAFLFLSTYAPEMPDGNNGGAHALSKSAVGYAGFVKLETERGIAVDLATDDGALKSAGLLVLTPETFQDPEALAKIVREREGNPTVIVLPKHEAVPNIWHKGWVYNGGLLPTNAIELLLSKMMAAKITRLKSTATATFDHAAHATPIFIDVPDLQVLAASGLTPLFTDDVYPDKLALNHFVIVQAPTNLFILSDPDLINNAGLADPMRAYGAARLLDNMLPADTRRITFDVTLNGFGHGRGLLDLVLRPPFLALTICLLVAAILALLNGLMRFGPAMTDVRAIPRGKRALVANTADLLKMSRREYAVGGRYVALVRDLAAKQYGLPATMDAEAMTARLDTLQISGPRFSELAYRAEYAQNRADLLDAAQHLDAWRRRL